MEDVISSTFRLATVAGQGVDAYDLARRTWFDNDYVITPRRWNPGQHLTHQVTAGLDD
jgi:hypothetical protein